MKSSASGSPRPESSLESTRLWLTCPWNLSPWIRFVSQNLDMITQSSQVWPFQEWTWPNSTRHNKRLFKMSIPIHKIQTSKPETKFDLLKHEKWIQAMFESSWTYAWLNHLLPYKRRKKSCSSIIGWKEPIPTLISFSILNWPKEDI